MNNKKIYSIEKGQLIALWVFGLLGFLFTLSPALDYGSGVALFFMLFIPFVLVFYTIGWKKYNKNLSDELKSSVEEKKKFSKNLISSMFAFLKNKFFIAGVIMLVLIISFININNFSKENIEVQTSVNNLPKPCLGDIGDILLVENKYDTYNLMNVDSYIGNDKNRIKIFGLFKNNSSCSLKTLKLKVTLQSSSNPDIKQDEVIIIPYVLNYVLPQQTKEYTSSFVAYESLLSKTSNAGFIERTYLKKDVKISTEVIGAEWAYSY
jgi:hypothetical protein